MSKRRKRAQQKIDALDGRVEVLVSLFHDLDERMSGSPSAVSVALELARALVSRRDLMRSVMVSQSPPTLRSRLVH